MKVVVITPESVKIRDIKNELSEFYNIIGCDLIDITRRKIGGVWFDIIVDDEGLLKPEPVLTAISASHHNDILVGNLIVCQSDKEGETIGLTNKECKLVRRSVLNTSLFNHNGDVSHVLLMD